MENGKSCGSKTSLGREGGGEGLHDCLRLPRLLTTNTRQLEILVTTLAEFVYEARDFFDRLFLTSYSERICSIDLKFWGMLL